MSNHFIINLPTKPYLRQYLETQYGSPVTFSTKDYFGMALCGAIDNPVRSHNEPGVIKMRFDKYEDSIAIKAPKWWLQKYEHGHSITAKQAFTINKLVEEKFEDELYSFCTQLSFVGQDTKLSIYQFCDRYNIEIDVHITYEALKKKEYRFRKNIEKNTADLSREGTRKILLQTLKGNLLKVS